MQRQVNLLDYSPSQQVGPYGIHALLMDAAPAKPVEGCWVPLFGAKLATLELSGSMDSLGLDVFGSNALEDPGNSYSITIAGSVTVDDVVSLDITNSNLPAGISVSHTSVGGDTATTIATALVAAINASSVLAGLSIRATNALGVITLAFPSFAPQPGAGNPSAPALANNTLVAGSVSGSATETIAIAVGTNGIKIGSTLAAFGLTALTVVPRWVKARLTTLTGTGANVSARLAASV